MKNFKVTTHQKQREYLAPKTAHSFLWTIEQAGQFAGVRFTQGLPELLAISDVIIDEKVSLVAGTSLVPVSAFEPSQMAPYALAPGQSVLLRVVNLGAEDMLVEVELQALPPRQVAPYFTPAGQVTTLFNFPAREEFKIPDYPFLTPKKG